MERQGRIVSEVQPRHRPTERHRIALKVVDRAVVADYSAARGQLNAVDVGGLDRGIQYPRSERREGDVHGNQARMGSRRQRHQRDQKNVEQAIQMDPPAVTDVHVRSPGRRSRWLAYGQGTLVGGGQPPLESLGYVCLQNRIDWNELVARKSVKLSARQPRSMPCRPLATIVVLVTN